MPCYFPLSAYQVIDPYVLRTSKKKLIRFSDAEKDYPSRFLKPIQLPCGQCIGCRLLRSVSWACRIMHEVQTTPDYKACFLTLTYDDENLPRDYSLDKDHIRNFIRRFRKAIRPLKIRYFLCGEYGDDSWRPHYHVILFGYNFTEYIKYKGVKHEPRKQLQYIETDNPYYDSTFLSTLWPFGYHVIANCTFDTAAYVARYCVKKINGDKADIHYNRVVLDWNEFTGEIYNFQEVDLEPEFALMSRGRNGTRGIGYEWYKKYKSDCYPSDYLVKDGSKLPVPKYYDKLLEEEDQFMLAVIKQEREMNVLKRAADLTPEMLDKRHYCKKQQSKNMKRRKI